MSLNFLVPDKGMKHCWLQDSQSGWVWNKLVSQGTQHLLVIKQSNFSIDHHKGDYRRLCPSNILHDKYNSVILFDYFM